MSAYRPLRSLPRVFLPGCSGEEAIDLPESELTKFRKVLRLQRGDEIAVLPNDGSLIRCRFEGRQAIPMGREFPNTESKRKVFLAHALPKGDRLETILRMGTELGVAGFFIFHGARSVAKWDANKVEDKLRRHEAIVREAAEQSFRSILPTIAWLNSFAEALKLEGAIVLSEREGLNRSLSDAIRTGDFREPTVLVVGPEGGWDPKELELIGDRGVTMGPLVLRTDTAGITAAALALNP